MNISSSTTNPDSDSDSDSDSDQESQFLSLNPKFGQLLSTLPKHYWPSKARNFYQYQGFWYPSFIVAGAVSAQAQFEAQPTDIIIAGSPKTGNTWLKAICYAIRNRDQDRINDQHPLMTILPHALVPYMEFEILKNSETENETRNPIISTHLPYRSLPESIKLSGCKIFYICREPKDTFVSSWHFTKRTEDLCTSPRGGSGTGGDHLGLYDEFDLFCQGKTTSGPYWDHVLGYYEASRERKDDVLFLKYEELVEDPVSYVKKIADFMGKSFSVEEETEGMPEKIVKLCSFKNLSEVNKSGKFSPIGDFQVDKSAFFRKGKIGDWEEYLTADMVEKIDSITEEKLKGSGFSFGVNQ